MAATRCWVKNLIFSWNYKPIDNKLKIQMKKLDEIWPFVCFLFLFFQDWTYWVYWEPRVKREWSELAKTFRIKISNFTRDCFSLLKTRPKVFKIPHKKFEFSLDLLDFDLNVIIRLFNTPFRLFFPLFDFSGLQSLYKVKSYLNRCATSCWSRTNWNSWVTVGNNQ